MESQPIGQELFNLFCARDHVLANCTKFLEELAALELMVDEKYAPHARSLYDQYLAEEVRCYEYIMISMLKLMWCY